MHIPHKLVTAEFNTIRLRLLKIGAPIKEASRRIRIAFAAVCPEAGLFRHIMAARELVPARKMGLPTKTHHLSAGPCAPICICKKNVVN